MKASPAFSKEHFRFRPQVLDAEAVAPLLRGQTEPAFSNHLATVGLPGFLREPSSQSLRNLVLSAF